MRLDRNSTIARLQSRVLTKEEFDFDKLIPPCSIYQIFPQYQIDKLYNIATSVRYSGNAEKKYKAIDQIIKPAGFVKLSAGTNRVVYRSLEVDDFVLKVASDAIGIGDNPREFVNQNIFKPFVAKTFEVTPDGVLGMAERVDGITSRYQFATVAADIFDVITNWFINGKYIMADIGSKFFMNWAIRRYPVPFGPVLCDYPYCYELDGAKLFCSEPDPNTPTGRCGGEIDYDDGYNFLFCTRCGKRYRVKELAKAVKQNQIITKGGQTRMKISVTRGNVTVKSSDNQNDGLLPGYVRSTEKVESKGKAAPSTGTLKVRTIRLDPGSKKEPVGTNRVKGSKGPAKKSDEYARGVVRSNADTKPAKKEKYFYESQLSKLNFDFEDIDMEYGIVKLKERDHKNAYILVNIGAWPEAAKQYFHAADDEAAETIKALSDKILTLEASIKDYTDSIAKRDEEINNLEVILDLRNKTIDEMEKKQEAVTSDYESAQKLIGEKTRLLHDLSKQIDELQVKIAGYEKQLRDIANKEIIPESMPEDQDEAAKARRSEITMDGYSTVAGEVIDMGDLLDSVGVKHPDQDHIGIVIPDPDGDWYCTDGEENIIVVTKINGKPVETILQELIDLQGAAPNEPVTEDAYKEAASEE